MKGKTTKVEEESRIVRVSGLWLDGYSIGEIVPLCSDWQVTRRTIEKYLEQAKQEVVESQKAAIEQKRDRVIKNLWKLYRKALPDSKEQHNLLKTIGKFEGLDRIQLNVSVEGERVLKDLPTEDLQKALEEDETES